MENLNASLEKLHLAEDQEVNKYKDEGFSIMEARCRFEQFRTKVSLFIKHYLIQNKFLVYLGANQIST